jgi:isopentenyl-diphosphate Delta-isomerase
MTELVDIVDENDNVIGKTTWDDAFGKNLLRRSVRVIILNSRGEMLLQKRSSKLKIHPGQWSSGATGSVRSGETYDEAAKRELKEEMGIETELKFLFKLRQHSPNAISGVFEGCYDGEIKPDAEEVEMAEFVSMDRVAQEIKSNFRDFTNSFKNSFRKYIEFKST